MASERQTQNGANKPENSKHFVINRWEVGEEVKIRWKKGPQFGVRQVVQQYGLATDGKKVPVGKQAKGEWTWYNIRGKRVGGPEQGGPVFHYERSPEGTKTEVKPGDKFD